MLNRLFGSGAFRTLEELHKFELFSSCAFIQMSNFSAPGEFFFVKGRSLQMHFMAPGCDLIEIGSIPEGNVAVFLNAGVQPCIIRDRVVAKNHLTGFQECGKFVAIHTGEYRSCVLLFDLNRVKALLGCVDYDNFLSGIDMSQSASIYAPEQIHLVNYLVDKIRKGANDFGVFSNFDSIIQLEIKFLKEWNLIATTANNHSPFRTNRRVRIVHAAVEYLTRCDLPNVSTSDIACAINISQRSLNAAFKGIVGETLASYIRKFRLNAARSDLLAGTNFTSVEQCAYHYGYKHVGKFIHHYKKVFSETPGKTLRKRPIAR